MIDRTKIGMEFPVFTAPVERGRLMFFAKATGQTDPIYLDVETAQAAGYGNLPAPPTFPFVLDMEAPTILPCVDALGLDMNRVLHGLQDFEYFGAIEAGDEITVTSRIADMYDKKGGALEFVVQENCYTNQREELVAKAVTTIVYRNA